MVAAQTKVSLQVSNLGGRINRARRNKFGAYVRGSCITNVSSKFRSSRAVLLKTAFCAADVPASTADCFLGVLVLLSYPYNIHRSKKLHTAYKYAAIYVGDGRRHTSDKCASTTADV